MFTGIIEEIGTIRSIEREGQAMVLTIDASRILEDVHLGDSIAVNGVCLTVIRYDQTTFAVDVMPETFRQTNLHELRSGSPVNLERAMAATSRFGGHIVQGHVDGTGVIVRRQREANAVVYTLNIADESLFDHIVERGSITIDGISLTVVSVGEGLVSVSIIPHTLEQTVLRNKHEGMTVNIETDIVGKYIAHLIDRRSADQPSRDRTGLSMTKLADYGFI